MGKHSSYFSIQSWMVQELKLRGAERDIYAIIYSFCQDGDSDFHGSLKYLSDMTGYSKNSVCSALQSLVDKGYIKKTEKIINNIKFCRYHTIELDTVQVICIKNEETVQVTCINNKQTNIDNKKENNKDIHTDFHFGKSTSNTTRTVNIDKFAELYNEHCFNLSKISKLTDNRIKAINKLLKNYSYEEIITVFDNANNSDFLKGNNDRGWKANIDFILREDKFVNILEGRYNSKPKINKQMSSDMNNVHRSMTAEQKKQFKEDIASGRAKKF